MNDFIYVSTIHTMTIGDLMADMISVRLFVSTGKRSRQFVSSVTLAIQSIRLLPIVL